MPRNEEGEFELVIGNRQLLSGFFIVIVLFGVLFAMGYIVGRHSSPTGPTAATQLETAPTVTPSSSSPHPGRAEVVVPETKPEPPAESAPTTRAATAPPEAPRPVETHAAEKKVESKVEPKPSGKGPSDPPPGRYLQVAAPNRAAAGGVVESLKNKGITARLAPGPNADTVRVIVGPLDPADVGKMRVDLQSVGYPSAFAKTY